MADGDTNRIPVNLKLLARFFSKIKIDPAVSYKGVPCWLWTAGSDKFDYGHFWFAGKTRRSPRFVYEMFISRLVDDLVVDHLCRVHACVNPVHLEQVTERVNVVERGQTFTAENARKTHCKRGHQFTPDNTRTERGSRTCLICKKIRSVARRKGRVKTHCRKGHPYTQESGGRGRHRCLVCIHNTRLRAKAAQLAQP